MQQHQRITILVLGNLYNTAREDFRVRVIYEILMDYRSIDNIIIEVFRNDLNKGYKRNLKYWNTYCCMRCNFWNEKDSKLELVMIFESCVKGFINCHAFIGIRPIPILKLILENYGYRIDLTLIRWWMISCFEISTLILIRLY